MSVDLPASNQLTSRAVSEKSDLRQNTLSYTTAETTANELPHPTTSFGPSDTGYQTASLVSIQLLNDTRPNTDLGKTSLSVAGYSPEKTGAQTWEPAVASTPNKRQQVNQQDHQQNLGNS